MHACLCIHVTCALPARYGWGECNFKLVWPRGYHTQCLGMKEVCVTKPSQHQRQLSTNKVWIGGGRKGGTEDACL